MKPTEREAIEAAIFALLEKRKAGASICPSEAARLLDPQNWRPLMGDVREVAKALAEAGRLKITQGGREIDVERIVGPIRLSFR
jgi:membrane carboxypeptidase/penicillin-binding protein PbpC